MASANVIDTFKPGENCTHLLHCERAAILIDAHAYFEAFMAAVEMAKHRVIITGWDFNRNLELKRLTDSPITLGDFLDQQVEHHPSLEIYIIEWDYPMVYAADRDVSTKLSYGWPQHERIHFRLDDRHPVGASVHDKLVTIDDEIAFCGSVDLTTHRWDTQEHVIDHPKRKTPSGEAYGPYHEIHVMLTGKAAKELAAINRTRWADLTDELLTPVETPVETRAPWPDIEPADFHLLPCAISRTIPDFGGRVGRRDLQRCLESQLWGAKKWIYIENQYFTDEDFERILAQRLGEGSQCPEIVVVLPNFSSGLLEKITMFSAQSRLVRRLRRKDIANRLHVVTPVVCEEGKEELIFVHSKILFMDDTTFHVGSANLTNRSMGLDSECDVTFIASSSHERRQVRAAQARVIAEHIGTDAKYVLGQMEEHRSIWKVLENGGSRQRRRLKTYEEKTVPRLLTYLAAGVGDPEYPLEARLRRFCKLRISKVRNFRNSLVVQGYVTWLPYFCFLALSLVGLVAWQFSHLHEYTEVNKLQNLMASFRGNMRWDFIAIVSFVVLGSLFFPITILVLLCAYLFEPWRGYCISLLGVLLSSLVSYFIGSRFTGGGSRLEPLGRAQDVFCEFGVLEVALIRNLPLAPFSLVNIIAGAAPIPLSTFLIGTAVGMTPGMLLISFLAGQVDSWT